MQNLPQTAAPGNWSDLSVDHRRRLAGYQIFSIADWQKLSRDRQLALFDIAAPLRAQLDSLAKLGRS